MRGVYFSSWIRILVPKLCFGVYRPLLALVVFFFRCFGSPVALSDLLWIIFRPPLWVYYAQVVGVFITNSSKS